MRVRGGGAVAYGRDMVREPARHVLREPATGELGLLGEAGVPLPVGAGPGRGRDHALLRAGEPLSPHGDGSRTSSVRDPSSYAPWAGAAAPA
ncbi:hypothetical protein GCM10010216_67140 [Streptomyces flaveolus]|nr:hypothetical protein GCM10010216_67140 [Streptomyces flaveolus]